MAENLPSKEACGVHRVQWTDEPGGVLTRQALTVDRPVTEGVRTHGGERRRAASRRIHCSTGWSVISRRGTPGSGGARGCWTPISPMLAHRSDWDG